MPFPTSVLGAARGAKKYLEERKKNKRKNLERPKKKSTKSPTKKNPDSMLLKKGGKVSKAKNKKGGAPHNRLY